jgi:hypothetical protein
MALVSFRVKSPDADSVTLLFMFGDAPCAEASFSEAEGPAQATVPAAASGMSR